MALDIERPAILGGEIEDPRLPSLDEVVIAASAAARAGRSAPCLVCHHAILPGDSGRCGHCGSIFT